MEVVFTPHAIFEIIRRSLTEEIVRYVVDYSEQHWDVRKGRHLYQARVKMGFPEKEYLIRVIVDVDRDPPEIVTAYRTSKIEKYWRRES